MKAKLGQNFLLDPSILEFEAEAADVSKKSVLEIGAGDGRLTHKLLSAGAGHITAVEIDPKFAKLLRMKFHTRVKVVEADFLLFDESVRFNRIVGNIPYYITSPILFKLAKMNFGKAILCIQKEVAARMIAEPGTSQYGRLSVSCQLLFKTEILAVVTKEAFSPKPKVDSCIISLEKTGFAFDSKTEEIIGAFFSHKKKNLQNAVVDARETIFSSKDKHIASQIAQTLKYGKRKVFTLSSSEVLEAVSQLREAISHLEK